MRGLVFAIVALVLALVATGRLDGWSAAWSVRDAKAAVAAEPPSAEAVARAIRQSGAALDAVPLSRRSRLTLADAVEAGVAVLGIERTAELAPQGALGRSVTADALDRHGGKAAATAVRAATAQARPEEIELLSVDALRRVGLAAAIAGRCREAVPLLEAAARRGRADWNQRVKYAGCLNDVDDPARALEILFPMRARRPGSRWVRLLLAESEMRLGHLETAEKIAGSLAISYPDFYDVWRFAGELAGSMGRPKEAAWYYRRALHLRPENRWLWRHIRALEAVARNDPSTDGTPPAVRAPASATATPS